MKLNNPFLIYGYVSPEYFCDRKTETEQLVSALRNGRNVTLMSPRRMGKTGLIKNAFHRISELYPDAICFYLDIYATQCLADFVKKFGEEVIGKLDSFPQKVKTAVSSVLTHCKISYSSDELLGAGQISLEFNANDANANLNDIFTYINKSECECFIAIDEFQQITEYPETNVEALLRTYIQQSPMLHFIFSGSKNHLMSAIFDSPKHPFFRSTEKMHLCSIPEDSYFLFAENHMKQTMTILPKEMFHWIYKRFDGHTWYVQYVLNKLYEWSPAIVDESAIKECILDIVKMNTEDYQKLFRMLTHNQKDLLHAIASEKNVPAINAGAFIHKYNLKGSSSVNKSLKFLIDNEYIYRYDSGYQVYDRFMELWLNQ